MPLTVLNVAYALAPVRPDTAGGAEQVLLALDRALVAAGHRSLVVASGGSQTAGKLLASAALPEEFTDAARRRAEAAHGERIAAALREWPVDVIHCHGIDFAAYLPTSPIPTLVTLHLAADFYAADALAAQGRTISFNCVSAAQRRGFSDNPDTLPVIENGVPVGQFATARHARRDFVLALGRICPEKGFHLALDAAAAAGVPLLIAGAVFPYAAHSRYFAQEIEPRLGAGARYLGALGFARKRRLLAAARCVLIPSRVAETSSLVAMEAAACGTPVIAFPSGALGDLVEPGVTGFLVDDARGMSEAIALADRLDRERIRAIARARFAEERMIDSYFALYRRLAVGRCSR